MISCRKLALLAAATATLSAPAYAQVDHSKMPGMTMPAPKKAAPEKAAPAKKPAAKKAPAKKPAAKPAPAKAADPHAGHDMSTMQPKAEAPAPPAQQPDAHAGHQMPMPQTGPAQPMPGHDMSTMPGMQMPGRDMPVMAAPAAGAEGTNLPAGNAPPPPVPVANAADTFFDRQAMEHAREHLREFHGAQKLFQVLNNIAEYQVRNGRDGYQWDSEGWYGGDINRFWFKSEGEGEFGGPLERSEVQALYSRAIDPYFNLQGGLRYDFTPDPSRVYATVQIEGLAPSFFDVEGALFLSTKGEVMARASGWVDQRITQRLILQPRIEMDFAAQSSPEIGVGAGLSKGEIGVRLRYDIRREFAPYIGVQYQSAFGNTAKYLRDAGEAVGGWQFLAGVRTWF